MPYTAGFPFRRLITDHCVVGVSRLSWELDYRFNDPTPHSFQLQAGESGLATSDDWVDVGSPAVDALYAEDDQRRQGEYGKRLITCYRVLLTTPRGIYASQPTSVYGQLNERDWLLAREIVRKERLRSGLVSTDGWLLKRRRFGEPCTRCRDPLTQEVTDSHCPECGGVGFQVGYHAPAPLALDWDPDQIVELRNGAEPPGPSRPSSRQARCDGMPLLASEDVWVDAKSDQRWLVREVAHAAEWRSVPLIVRPTLSLLPMTDAAYQIEVGGEPAALLDPQLPGAGTGCVEVDHDFGGLDELAYQCDGSGISGARILAFTREAYEAGASLPGEAIAASSTLANGRWSWALLLDPGEYTLVYEKPGQYGPDAVELTVLASSSSG